MDENDQTLNGLFAAYDRAGRPRDWLHMPELVRQAEKVASKMWLGGRDKPFDKSTGLTRRRIHGEKWEQFHEILAKALRDCDLDKAQFSTFLGVCLQSAGSHIYNRAHCLQHAKGYRAASLTGDSDGPDGGRSASLANTIPAPAQPDSLEYSELFTEIVGILTRLSKEDPEGIRYLQAQMLQVPKQAIADYYSVSVGVIINKTELCTRRIKTYMQPLEDRYALEEKADILDHCFIAAMQQMYRNDAKTKTWVDKYIGHKEAEDKTLRI